GFQMQNPHWIINRDFFINNKERYLMGAGLKYAFNKWINVTGRLKMDNNNTIAEKKFSASTSGLFASDAGAYHKAITNNKQLYGDLIVNANRKIASDLNLEVNLGASLIDVKYNM